MKKRFLAGIALLAAIAVGCASEITMAPPGPCSEPEYGTVNHEWSSDGRYFEIEYFVERLAELTDSSIVRKLKVYDGMALVMLEYCDQYGVPTLTLWYDTEGRIALAEVHHDVETVSEYEYPDPVADIGWKPGADWCGG